MRSFWITVTFKNGVSGTTDEVVQWPSVLTTIRGVLVFVHGLIRGGVTMTI